MFALFLDFYVRIFAVLLPASAAAIAAFHAVRAGLPLARAIGAALVLARLLAIWTMGAPQQQFPGARRVVQL